MTTSDTCARQLSPLQASMLVASLRATVDPYLRQTSVRFNGGLDVPALQSAWNAVVARHSVLRTSFEWRGLDRFAQRVQPAAHLPFRFIDCAGLVAVDQDALRQHFIAQDRTRGLPLDRAPLMRVTLFRQTADGWYAVWTYHHLVLDGWSRTTVFKDISARYRAARATAPASFEAAPQFGAYLDWLERQDRPAAEAFWREALHGCDGALLTDRDALARHDSRSISRSTTIPPDRLNPLAAAARGLRVTLNTVVCGAWALLLGQWLGARDVTFGICSSGRAADIPGVEHVVGPLMSVVPMRVRLPVAASTVDFLRALQSGMQAAQRYAYLSLPDIQAQSSVPQDRPLFDTLVNFQRGSTREKALATSFAGLESEFFEQHTYPLVLQVLHGRGLGVRLDWQPAHVASDTAAAILDAVVALTAGLLADPKRRVADVPVPAVEWRPRRAVPEPRAAGQGAADIASAGAVPDGFQQELASIWMDVLQVTQVEPGDSFFALGGHSLLANAVAARVERRLGIDVPITLLFEVPTFAQFAVAIWQREAGAGRPAE